MLGRAGSLLVADRSAQSLTENSHAPPVIPAESGNPGPQISALALGPSFRGGDDDELVISGSFSVTQSVSFLLRL